MDLPVTPVGFTHSSKHLYPPDQRPRNLILVCFNQHGPVVARTPGAAGKGRFTEPNHVKDQQAARTEVERIAREVLTNPVIEEFTYRIEE